MLNVTEKKLPELCSKKSKALYFIRESGGFHEPDDNSAYEVVSQRRSCPESGSGAEEEQVFGALTPSHPLCSESRQGRAG